MTDRCSARIWDGWHKRRCMRNATGNVLGAPLCTQHTKKAEQWDREERARGMMSYHWSLNLKTKGTTE